MKNELTISFESSPNLAMFLHSEIKKMVESHGATNVKVKRKEES